MRSVPSDTTRAGISVVPSRTRSSTSPRLFTSRLIPVIEGITRCRACSTARNCRSSRARRVFKKAASSSPSARCGAPPSPGSVPASARAARSRRNASSPVHDAGRPGGDSAADRGAVIGGYGPGNAHDRWGAPGPPFADEFAARSVPGKRRRLPDGSPLAFRAAAYSSVTRKMPDPGRISTSTR